MRLLMTENSNIKSDSKISSIDNLNIKINDIDPIDY
jgi:hypothetical protein